MMTFTNKCLLSIFCGMITLFNIVPSSIEAKPKPNSHPHISKQPNYTRLKKLLAAGKWQEADLETWKQMAMFSKSGDDYLTADEMNKFPCNHLGILNQLWLKSSKNRFGFSVQRKIWQDFGGKTNFDENIYRKFVIRVGWYTKDSTALGGYRTINTNNLIYSLKAPQGHLPGIPLSDYGVGGGFGGASGWRFIPRAAFCKI